MTLELRNAVRGSRSRGIRNARRCRSDEKSGLTGLSLRNPSGCPKGLKKEEMSLPARMLAIADIFEALTAVDRPYKEGKTLSEALKIMSAMKKDQHIDPDLFDLFLRAGVYREYAERFMRPEQIDAVDIAAYV
jgi:hypothetical protein